MDAFDMNQYQENNAPAAAADYTGMGKYLRDKEQVLLRQDEGLMNLNRNVDETKLQMNDIHAKLKGHTGNS